jgi:hypothetical protein
MRVENCLSSREPGLITLYEKESEPDRPFSATLSSMGLARDSRTPYAASYLQDGVFRLYIELNETSYP